MLVLVAIAEPSRADFVYSTSAVYADSGGGPRLEDSHVNGDSNTMGEHGRAFTLVSSPDSGAPIPPKLGAFAHVTTPADQLPIAAEGKVTATDHLTVFTTPEFQGSLATQIIGREVVTLSLHGFFLNSYGSSFGGGSDAFVNWQLTIPYVDQNGEDQVGTKSGQKGYEHSKFGTIGGTNYPGVEIVPDPAVNIEIPFEVELGSPLSGLAASTLTLTLDTLAYAWPGDDVSVDFSNTLSVSSIAFYDANGDIIPGLGVRGDSGADYPVLQPQASAVPEPASVCLFGIGLVSMAGYAWRRRRPQPAVV